MQDMQDMQDMQELPIKPQLERILLLRPSFLLGCAAATTHMDNAARTAAFFHQSGCHM
jgi:hypothetical protein